MARNGRANGRSLLVVAAILLACATVAAWWRTQPVSLLCSIQPAQIRADGVSSGELRVHATRFKRLRDVHSRVLEGEYRINVGEWKSEGSDAVATVRAGAIPGDVLLEITAADASPVRVHITVSADMRDTMGDGTPDALRLVSSQDRRAFRTWFSFLAESGAAWPADKLPAEINDCAALIRFAYREALRPHDSRWASALALSKVPGAPAVGKYSYPHTMLGTALFRTHPGPFRAEDVANGAFAQFADAKVLRTFNTHFVSRDLRRALPGDLLFFHQPGQKMPFHAMVFVGASHYDGSRLGEQNELASRPEDNWLVYHTGPEGRWKGEVRRVTVGELLRHPQPQWRPMIQNENFLGVYRWNILREMDERE